jgi:3-hydroxyacyl-CoA dehydrogenase/enoyl-CoA hydratase/3-hydroxybutyryl-CoA epimerase
MSDGLKRMFEAGYHGRKNKKGFFQYDAKGKKIRDKLDNNVYQFFGGRSRKSLNDQEIVERVSLSMVGEAALCLQEGIISCPLDGDVGAVFGLGFPPFRGGPFRYMDSLGAQKTLDSFHRLANQYGPRFKPCQLLIDQAGSNARFYP